MRSHFAGGFGHPPALGTWVDFVWDLRASGAFFLMFKVDGRLCAEIETNFCYSRR